MARCRNIKWQFFSNELLGEIDPLARLLFIGLWGVADRLGLLEDRPARIKAQVLPFDDCDVSALLDALAKRGFIVRYSIKGAGYIAIPKFLKHQHPHFKEPESIIPPPPGFKAHKKGTRRAPGKPEVNPVPALGKTDTGTGQAQEPPEVNPADCGILIIDSGLQRGAPPAAAPTEPDATLAKEKRGTRLHDDWQPTEAEIEFALQARPTWTREHVANIAASFADHWRAKPGKEGRKTDWAATWRNWVRHERSTPATVTTKPSQNLDFTARVDADARALGITPRPGESYSELAQRINAERHQRNH